MKEKILGIWGAGGLGREILELARIIDKRYKRWNKFIFIVDGVTKKEISNTAVLEYNEAKELYNNSLEVIVAIGEPVIREKKYAQLEKDNIAIATLIHPDVYIPDTAKIGKGVVIQYGCFISCNVTIENYVYIQPQCNIGHDDVLHKGCIVSSFGNLAGMVNVGENTYLAMSTTIKEGVSVGANTVIGMGSVVHRDIPDSVIAMGNPARPMKNNEDRYIFKK